MSESEYLVREGEAAQTCDSLRFADRFRAVERFRRPDRGRGSVGNGVDEGFEDAAASVSSMRS